MTQALLPKNVTRIGEDETFCFACHPAIPCFTDCCRQLELALTPYDILRLKKACGLRSDEFLDRYVIIEHEQHETFPRFYLTMVDDGRASCVFVAKDGCSVYADRPGACRAYPLGRAAIRQADGGMDAYYVLLKELHCSGFQEQRQQNIAAYSLEQDLALYNRFNDTVATIFQHDQIRQGKQLSEEQIDFLVLALYNLDQFRDRLLAGDLPLGGKLDDATLNRLGDDEELLLHAVDWLNTILFTP